MKWVGYRLRLGQVRKAYSILVGTLKGRDYLEDLGIDVRML
jgi:hypothetical protein